MGLILGSVWILSDTEGAAQSGVWGIVWGECHAPASLRPVPLSTALGRESQAGQAESQG